MAKYGIAIDIARCTGCFNCFLACKDEYVGNDYLPTSIAQPEVEHNWMSIKEVEQGTGTKVKVNYIPLTCMHCDNPPCATVAPEGAVYKRDDGVVIIDPVKAKGCKEIVNACPYGVVTWNEEQQLAQKCTMCVQMLDNGEKTVRCVEACPTQAMVFGDLDDKDSAISQLLAKNKERVEDYKPEFGTKPIVKYLSLPKYFITGEVVLSDKEAECPRDLEITMVGEDGQSLTTKTDFFGDFEFNNVAKNQVYTIKVKKEGYLPAEMTVRTYASRNIGEIVLQAK